MGSSTNDKRVGGSVTQQEYALYNRHMYFMSSNRHMLSKVRKPYRYKKVEQRLKARLPIRCVRIYYPFKKKTIDDIRTKVVLKGGSDIKSTKRTKNLVVALSLVMVIVCVLGLGSYFLYFTLMNKNANRVVTGEVVFVNSDSISVPIENARLNRDIEKQVRIRNETSGAMYVRFRIDVTDEKGLPATGKLLELGIRYTYDTSMWYLDTGQNYLYYVGVLLRTAELEPITHFQIYTVYANEDYWAGKTIGVKFTVEVEQERDPGEDWPIGWSSGWQNIMNGLEEV